MPGPPPPLKMVEHNGFLKILNQEAIAVLAANYGKPGKPMAEIRILAERWHGSVRRRRRLPTVRVKRS